MTTITLDTKLFDYSDVNEPLIAVPKSFLADYIKSKNKLTKADLLKSMNSAKRDIKNGKTINARKYIESLK